MNDIPDEVIITIMTFASFGKGSMERRSPASRFAHVSRKWNRLYQQAKAESLFETNELRRVTQGMTIRTCPETDTGAGGVETILDCWEKVRGVPQWWASSYVFEGGVWDPGRDAWTDYGPFFVEPRRSPPTLLVNFDRPITIRAICFWARNKPRLVYCFKQQQVLQSSTPLETGSANNTLHIPKAPFKKDGDFYKRSLYIYGSIVAEAMPQGRTPTEFGLEEIDLPTILPEPITVNVGESFGIRILATQERGWVGINNLLLFE